MKEPTKKHIGLFETRPGFGGGNRYQKMVISALSQKFNVKDFHVSLKIFPKAWRPRMLVKIMYLNRTESSIDLWIRNFLGIVGMKFLRRKTRNIALFFHLDHEKLSHRWLTRIWVREFWKNIRKCEKVVVISKYWEAFMRGRGVENTKIIYHGHNINKFVFTETEIDEFKERYGLTGKPIIYLGNCQENKGAREAYESLKDLPYHLVTSGKKEVDIPALHLELPYREYLRLLKSAAVVLTMSKFLEGWNITAHEAMLCQTPVIGSGAGGMRELLEGGQQILCDDFTKLPVLVDYAIRNSDRLGRDGYSFAKEFSYERFQKDWIELINNL
jgi:glycosyltransferase involved in cell wall biosynthesis